MSAHSHRGLYNKRETYNSQKHVVRGFCTSRVWFPGQGCGVLIQATLAKHMLLTVYKVRAQRT